VLKRVGVLLVLVAVMAAVFPAAEAQDQGLILSDRVLDRLSQGALIPYLKEHPDQAPEQLSERLRALEQAVSEEGTPSAQTALDAPAGVGTRFNSDNFGLPQNEESVTACRLNADVVLGGTNDYRGLFDPQENFTGWHFSNDGGQSLQNEGLLPPVRIGGRGVPSGGDPVVVADADCNLYAGSLNYDPATFEPNGIGVYRTTPETLGSCTGGTDPACWPTRRAVAVGGPGHFLDKEWIHVSPNGSGGTVVWAVYTDFGPVAASIKAVRCRADLSRCTDPIRISGDDRDVQFGDVTVDSNGRVYITWTEIQAGPRGNRPQTFVHKLRTAAPGSTSFGPERIVAVENQAIPFAGDFGILNANDFRAATYPKNEVRLIDGKPRVFVVWDACQERVTTGGTSRPITCENPEIKLKTSDDQGASWSPTMVVSEEGGNYFPTISSDPEGPNVAIAYFTNRHDPRFQNEQDVELVTLDPVTSDVVARQRLTSLSNESESDPVLGGFFIGDYIEVFALQNQALVHYNANYRQIRLLESGLPVPQQDNFLERTNLG
jgi:hypothetical protein